ncbi:MAG TPA: hypothetical protein VM433_02925 [Mycobacteriales bacterium]|nr:hypothetical protein [Mycobacteriales bacterium]
MNPGSAGVRLDPRPLAAVSAAVVLLAVAGVVPTWPGLVHVVALPPLDLVSDLGALLTLAPSLPVFVLGTAAALLGRAAVLALLLGGLTRARFLWALRFYLVVSPLAAIAAVLLYGAGAVMFYLLFWAGVVVTLLLVGATAAAAWVAPGRVRSGFGTSARAGFRLGTVGCYVALLLVLGALAELGGTVVQVLLVPVSAALTFAAARVLVHDPALSRRPRRAVAALPAAGAVALLAAVLHGPAGPAQAGDPENPRPGSLLLMSGVDSSSGSGAMLEIDPRSLGWTCERTRYFSYAGPGDGQPQNEAECPIDHGAPYEAADSLRGSDDVVPFLEQQVAPAPDPVVVATHSQGAWLVWEAAVTGRLPGVETLVLVGPFPDSGVPFATDEEPRAPVGRLVVDLVADLPRPGGTTAFEPGSPLGVEWLARPERVREVLSQPLPEGMRAISVTSAFDVPLMRGTHRLEHAVDACPVPVPHPNLPYSAELHDAVQRFLDDEPLPPCAWWRSSLGPLLRHFAVPPPS